MATASVDIELTDMPAQSSSGEQSKSSKTMGDDLQLRTVIGEATDNAEETTERINETSLAPVDRGFGAWSFLAAAVIVDAVVWGFPNTYGVFLAKYLDDPYWSSQNKASFLLPLVGPLSSGIMYCTGPITYPLVARYPRHRRTSMWLGLVVIFASLLGASYARTIVSLVALQGVLYGIGGALLYAPTIYYMSEWFRIRRGLANGVIDAGTAVGGLILPLILPPLLNKHSTSKTLRYLSIAQGTLLLVTVPFIRGRLPVNRVQGPSARGYRSSIVTRAYARNKTFWIIILATLLQGLAYYIPVLWLPTYASSLRLSPSSASLALALLNGTSVIGRISLGMLSDRFSPWLLASSTLLCTALTVFILWGLLSYTFAGIIIYGIAYGFLASGYQSLWTAFVRPIAKDDPTISTTIFGFLMLSRGIGNILSTPISTALQPARSPLSPSPSPPAGIPHVHEIGFKIDGGQYEKVIVYAGSCFVAAAAVIAAGWVVERRYPSSSGVNTTRR